MSALLVGGASTFVSCKDYDGDQAAVTNASVKGLSEKLQEQIAALEAAKVELAQKADKSEVAALQAAIDATIANLQSQIDANEAGIAQNATDIAAVQADIVAIDGRLGNLEGFETQVKSLFGENLENVLLKGSLADYAAGEGAEDFLGAMLVSLNKAIAAAGTENFTDVTSLFEYLDKTIPAELKDLASKCAYLAGQDSLLNSRIDSLVTSVNVDMVSNPIYGTFNTPFGVKSYVLCGFVGDEIERDDFNGVKVGGLLASANGGQIYLTVNPAEVDAEGWSLNLVGRDGNPAPGFGNLVLVADNTPVTTVTTRTSNNLGGYVADAKIDDAAAAKVVIDKEGLKDVAKNVLGKLRGEQSLDITNAVRTIYNQFNNIIPQYYAVKCQVKDDKSYGETKTKTYVSDYNIAAVTVKPLSYTTNLNAIGAKVNIPSIPSFEELLGIEIKDIEFSNVNVNEITSMKFAAKAQQVAAGSSIPTVDGIYDNFANNDKQVYIINGGEVMSFAYTERVETEAAVGVIPATYEYSVTGDVSSVITEINNSLSSVAADVNETLGTVQDALDKAGKYYDKVAPKLNQVISKVNSLLDNANQLLQPVMIGACGDKAFRLSEVAAAPTVVKANGENAIVLAPTSYTVELLAPAYKKSIKVNGEQINGDDLDGATKTVVASLVEGDNTIEYEAMDFYGKKVKKTYYIKVVK